MTNQTLIVSRNGNEQDDTITKTVFVDAGMVWLGDPCYIVKDADWDAFCQKADNAGLNDNDVAEPFGHGSGLAIRSGDGDGEYTVKITKDAQGEVRSIHIDF